MRAMDKQTFLAALSAARVGGSDGLIKIVPKGQFAPVDGRTDTGVPHWTMTAALAQQIIAAFDSAQTDLVVDYEHATLKAAETGQQNPAAGWISKYVWDDERGLMGEVKWTERAKSMIDSGEYRYLSPVLEYDTQGNVVGLHSVALTNAPALDGMALAALSKQNAFNHPEKGKPSMNKEALIKLLGLAADADDEAINTALAALQEKAGDKSLNDLLTAEPESKPEDKPAPENTVGEKNEAGEIEQLKAQVAALSKQVAGLQVEGSSDKLILAALSDGRLLPHQEASARQLAAKDPEAFKNLMEGSLKLAALSKTQTGGKGGAAADPAAGLSAVELEAARACGLSPEDYAKAKGEA
ncbi:transcriptional regulator [Neisseria dumasiana]|uniref:Transcriptional regulator n=2 Tax=Neisseria dumasiana TaxID=1931275 RepID=A0A1X3DLI1_9NEIS|nr:transcriptional regulator [Neisseria dumasiana]